MRPLKGLTMCHPCASRRSRHISIGLGVLQSDRDFIQSLDLSAHLTLNHFLAHEIYDLVPCYLIILYVCGSHLPNGLKIPESGIVICSFLVPHSLVHNEVSVMSEQINKRVQESSLNLILRFYCY